MSYLVLARKWRPQIFDQLLGQETIVRILKNSIDQGRIAHAYLFSGPKGVGKTSTARILSKALNCKDGPTSSPCGLCPSCTSIIDGSSIDVIEIDGASNNSVNDIRDLRERVKYVPSGGRYKVYIIDETHMLSDSAFNALLKTLEEPPSHVIFVLATTAPQKIPGTVLSRCQHLPFRRISSLFIKEHLRIVSDVEGITISNPSIDMIARAGDGSLRDSLMILDQLSSFTSDIQESDVRDLLGITEFGIISQLAVALIEGKRKEILKITSGIAEKGIDIRSLIKELIQFFRDLLVASIVRKPDEILDLNQDEMGSIKNILLKTSEDQLTLLLSELMKAEIDIRNAHSARLAFEMSLIKASFLNYMHSIKEIIEDIETYIKPDSAKELSGHEKKHVDTESVTKEFWGKAIKKLDTPLSSKLSKAEFKLTGDILVILLNGGDALFADSIQKNIGLIEDIFSEEIGHAIKVEVKTTKKKAPRKQDLKEKAIADPAIQEVLELFNGRIVDVNSLSDQEE